LVVVLLVVQSVVQSVELLVVRLAELLVVQSGRHSLHWSNTAGFCNALWMV
jgi:hypothetical protein